MIYQIHNGAVMYGAETILKNINFEIKNNKEKIAIVGRNGCGKTTLLKLICGEIELVKRDSDEDIYIAKTGNPRIGYLKQMAEDCDITADIKTSNIGRFPEIFILEEQSLDDEKLWEYLKASIDEACDKFVEARINEGENLKKDLISKLDNMLDIVAFIEEKSPEIIADYKKRLMEKIDELNANTQIDDQRIALEVTLYADKICVDEEIVRLKSHIESAKNILIEGGAVGRKLDFIAQEMNREANTILSKSNSLLISDKGIELKTEIEKVREQIQNIE